MSHKATSFLFPSISALIAASSVLGVACGGVTEPTQAVPSVTPDVAPAPSATAAAKPDPPKPAASCGVKVETPACGSVSIPPTSSSEISAFVRSEAMPLRCGSGADATWDLSPLVDLFGDQRAFMMGEVHGTNEIGIVSDLTFRALAAAGRVNVVAYELPMDLEPALQRYVDGADDSLAKMLLGRTAQNFFGNRLTRAARAVADAGKPMKLGAVDIPSDPRFAELALDDLAAKLSTKRSLVTATLPRGVDVPASPEAIAATNAYFDHIASKKSEICSELSTSDCDRLEAMTHALWASTVTYDDVADPEEWFARREVVIYYNLRSKLAAPSDRLYLHMGAAHTSKYTFSAGSRLAHEYAPTKGQVFSVAPAYGDGSVVWYGEDVPMEADPASVAKALGHKPAHPSFVSVTRPSAACAKNPIGTEPLEGVRGGSRAESYDGYIHYGQLTPETRPNETTLSAPEEIASSGPTGRVSNRLAVFRGHVERMERAAAARLAARRGPVPVPMSR